MVKSKNASNAPASSSPGSPRIYMGAYNDDDEGSLEAPRRTRSKTQVAAFEKARATRAANLAKKTKKAAPEPEPDPEPEPTPPPAPEPAAKAAPRRKPRSDAGKRRGRLVRYEDLEEEEGEPEVSSAPPPPYFVIV